jgi:hypothetical protein
MSTFSSRQIFHRICVKPIILGNEVAQVSTFDSIAVKPYSLLPRQSSYTKPPENTAVITNEYSAVVLQKVRGIFALLLYSENQICMLLVEHQAKLNSNALQCYSCRTLVYLHESIDCSFMFLRAAPEDSTPLLCNRP